MSIIFREYKPAPALSPYIQFFWTGTFNVNSGTNLLSQKTIPNGYVELIIHLNEFHCELLQGTGYAPSPKYLMVGLFTKPYDVHFRKEVKVFGIRFKPEGIYHIFGMPASEMREDFADAESITGKTFREYSSRLTEAKTVFEMISLSEKFISGNISRNRINLYYLNNAVEIIRKHKGMLSINELAGKVYIGARQLEREFKQKIGISPKRYMRIVRLNEVNRMINSGRRINLSEVSFTAGYSDQAHFIRDFKYFTGETPNVLISKKDEYIINPGPDYPPSG
ncbi:MAG: helix-turn-helix domain-containing protein [Ignavibacteriaceae bacterium]